jgi:beta-1,4-N-acetylglucosaminyltransferase
MPWLALILNGIHAIVIFLKEHVLFLASLFSLALLRLAYLLVTKSSPRKKRDKDEKCHIAIFLGSGGHTTEMLQLIGFLPPERYCCRTYITTEGDSFSRSKAMEREKSFSAQLAGSDKSHQRIAIISLPRARKVHQTWLSTPLSVIVTFVYSAYHVIITPRTSRKTASGLFADLIIMNGPGSCVPLVMAVYVLRVSQIA